MPRLIWMCTTWSCFIFVNQSTPPSVWMMLWLLLLPMSWLVFSGRGKFRLLFVRVLSAFSLRIRGLFTTARALRCWPCWTNIVAQTRLPMRSAHLCPSSTTHRVHRSSSSSFALGLMAWCWICLDLRFFYFQSFWSCFFFAPSIPIILTSSINFGPGTRFWRLRPSIPLLRMPATTMSSSWLARTRKVALLSRRLLPTSIGRVKSGLHPLKGYPPMLRKGSRLVGNGPLLARAPVLFAIVWRNLGTSLPTALSSRI
jgi:hypothetical protein